MTSAITLDMIRDAAEKKYGATEVDLGDGKVVHLINPLRISKEKRDEISGLNFEDFDDPIDYFEKAFAAASTSADAKAIRKALGEDDVTLYVSLFEAYSQGIDLGEASPSQD